MTIPLITQDQEKQLSSCYPVLAETGILKPVATATVPARTKPFDAAAFYQTGTGFCVFSTFANRLGLAARRSVASTPERPYVALLLKAGAYDRDIERGLPERHLSMLEDIASFFEAQPNGESGFLLANGYANIFYVEGKDGQVFAVRVFWHSGGHEWRVRDWERGRYGCWGTGNRVLCPGNAAL